MNFNNRGFPSIILVFIGGFFGTLIRVWLMEIFPSSDALWPILLINLLGAFLLGALTSFIGTQSGPAARRLQLLAGMGLLGGFTSYSALALTTIAIAPVSGIIGGVIYGLGTVIGGLILSLIGLKLGSHQRGQTA